MLNYVKSTENLRSAGNILTSLIFQTSKTLQIIMMFVTWDVWARDRKNAPAKVRKMLNDKFDEMVAEEDAKAASDPRARAWTFRSYF